APPGEMSFSSGAPGFWILPSAAAGNNGCRFAQDPCELLESRIGTDVAFNTEGDTFGQVFCCGTVRRGKAADGRTEHMRLGMRSRLVDAVTDTLNEIGRTDLNRLDKERGARRPWR